MPNVQPMAYPEHSIRLDTGAFRAARATRIGRGATYWALLAAGAGAVVLALSVVVPRLAQPDTPRAAGFSVAPAPASTEAVAPAAKETRVAIWNASHNGARAKAIASSLARVGYPIVALRRITMHARGKLVLFTPGSQPAAVALARHLGLNPARAVQPLDGISPATISPAVLLVVIGR